MTRTPTCTGRKKNGAQCTYPPLANQPHCRHHATTQYRDRQEAETRPNPGPTPTAHPTPETPVPHDPFADIATFCQLHDIPYTPPDETELAAVDNFFEHGAREHAWLRAECEARNITYPWTGDPADFEEFGQHLRTTWATQRAANERETLDIATQIDRATTHQHRARQEPGQNRARQEAAPSPRTPAPGARPPAPLSPSDRQEAAPFPTTAFAPGTPPSPASGESTVTQRRPGQATAFAPGTPPSPAAGEGAGGEGPTTTPQYRDPQEAEASPNIVGPTPTADHLPFSMAMEKGPGDEESYQASKLELPPSQIQNEARASKNTYPTCTQHLPSGRPCQRLAMKGATHCYQHNPATRERAHRTSSQGGLNSHGTLNAIDVPIDFSTAAGIQAALATLTRAYVSGHASHKQILGFTRIARLAVQNARNHPRVYDYFEANDRLEQTLDDIQLALGLANYQERIDAIAEHRERLNAITEQAKELGIPARPSRPTLPRN